MQFEFKCQGNPDEVIVVAVGIYQLLKTENTFFARTRKENHLS